MRHPGAIGPAPCLTANTRFASTPRTRGRTWCAAKSRQQQGDLKDAIADFEQGIRLDPKIARSFTFKAQCYLEAGESDKVLAELNEAIRRDANEVEAYVLRGHAWQQKGDASQALRAYNEAIRVAPRSAVAYIARAEYYGACEDFDKALADANEAIRLDPIAEAYITRAHVACCRGDLKTAVADLGEAIRLDPKDIRALLLRADCFLDRREFDKALKDVNEAIKLDGKNATALGMRGELLMLKGRTDLALADLNKSIEHDSKSVDAYVARAGIHVSKGELGQALADLDKAIEIDPKDADALEKRALTLSLKTAQDRSRADDTGCGLSHVPGAKNDGVSFMFPLVDKVAHDRKADERILADLNESIRIDPRNAAAYTDRGMLFSQQGALRGGSGRSRQGDFTGPEQSHAAFQSGWRGIHAKGLCDGPGGFRRSAAAGHDELSFVRGTWARLSQPGQVRPGAARV